MRGPGFNLPAGGRVLAGLMLAVSFFLIGAGVAAAETRTLKLYFVHTREKAEITYKKNGRYISSGLQQVNRFLRDWRRNEPTKMDPKLIDLLWDVYRASGSRDYIHVISAYRSPATNSMLRQRSNGVAKKSQHMLGKAIDFYIPDVKLSKLRAVGLKMEGGGVGFYPSSGSPFVHLDVGNVRHWPRMNRQQLMAVFPDGRTVHMPSDGKPLPGYKQALAAYESRKRSGSSVQIASTSGESERRSGGGLLSALFGGGADEEEDNSEAAAPATRPAAARPAAVPAAAPPVAAPPVAVQPEPEPEPVRPQTPETIIAALPARSIPLPLAAPRPSVGIGEETPAATAAALLPETAPVAEQVEAAPPVEVALGIPLPTRRPDYSPQPEMQIDAAAALALAAATEQNVVPFGRPGADAAPAEPTAALAAFVPLPAERPNAKGTAVLMAALPASGKSDRVKEPFSEPMPSEALPVPAPRTLRYAGAGAEKASQRVALLTNEGSGNPLAVANGGVRTTQKSGRPGKDDTKPERKTVRVPVETEVARWALYGANVTRVDARSEGPSLAFNAVREAPKVVYTAGFRQTGDVTDVNRFSGKAVTFMSVAKFGTN